MTLKLTDYLNAINVNKNPLMDTEDDSVERGYVPFLVNRGLSYFSDTIMQANAMNRYSGIRKKMQFDFLRNSIRARKRFSKWYKAVPEDALEVIKERYCCSDSKARDILNVLTPDQVESICNSKGGA